MQPHNNNISLVNVWPRGISANLTILSPSSASQTIDTRAKKSSTSLVQLSKEWEIKVVDCIDDDPEKAIIQSQEKLRQHSVRQFGATGGQIEVGVGPKPLLHDDVKGKVQAIGDARNDGGNDVEVPYYLTNEFVAKSLELLDLIENNRANDDNGILRCFDHIPIEGSLEGRQSSITSSSIAPTIAFEDELIDTRVDISLAWNESQSANASTFNADDAQIPSSLGNNAGSSIGNSVGVRSGVHRLHAIVSDGYFRESYRRNSMTSNEPKSIAAVLADLNQLDDGEGNLDHEPEESPHDVLDSIDVSEIAIDCESNLLISPDLTDQTMVDISSTNQLSDEIDELDAILDLETTSGKISTEKTVSNSISKVAVGKEYLWAEASNLDEAEYDALRPRMAMTFPFELDTFQKQAVMRLERRECVFVAAHTSAGKTVVAEYAISMAKKHATRTIYTSPIKALSNQKYRDFKGRFGEDDIGLVTGDISINPDASCIIMTTEILRSMLYRGADTIKDIEWVIFDEVHYVNDAERGVVWEEVIILLPDRINLIFLSATTPNTFEFSDWIGRTKQRKVYVTSTMKRPVPLQHFLYHDDEVYKLMQAEKGYDPSGLQAAAKREKEKSMPKVMSSENKAMQTQRQQEKAAMAAQYAGKAVAAVSSKVSSSNNAKPAAGGGSASGGRTAFAVGGSKHQWIALLNVLKQGGREESGGLGAIDFGLGFSGRAAARAQKKSEMLSYEKLPEFLRQEMTKQEYEKSAGDFRADDQQTDSNGVDWGLLPTVIFSFSKKKCEEIADNLKSQDLLNAREKGEVRATVLQMMKRLNPLDAGLPQVTRMEEMMLRGVAVHHGGLLPILKECVEILFAQSVIKVLIATETFAMGVNMPARSVVFNGYRKHDGKAFRDLLPGEYTQMAGRAGRRGLDKVGTVIIAAWSELPPEQGLKQLLTGVPMKLTSQFRLSYSMILNLLRVHDLSVEDMIKRSFSEFHTQRALTAQNLPAKLKTWEHRLSILKKQRSSTDIIYNNENGLLTVFNEDVDQFVNQVTASQTLIQGHLREFVTNKRGDTSSILCPGRVVMALMKSQLSQPTFGVIVASCKSQSSTSLSAGASAPNILAGLRSGDRTMLSMTSAASNSGGSDKYILGEDLYWILFVLPMGECPVFREDRSPDSVPTTPAPTAASDNTLGMIVKKKDMFDVGLGIPRGGKSAKGKTDTGPASIVWSQQSGIVEESNSTQGSFQYHLIQCPLKDLVSILNKKLKTPASMAHSDLKTCARQLLRAPPAQLGLNYVWAPCRQWTSGADEFDHCSSVDLGKELGKQLDLEFSEEQRRVSSAAELVVSSALACGISLGKQYQMASTMKLLQQKMRLLKLCASNESLSLFPDFLLRLSLLRRLGYVEDDRDTVTLKGRVACEMNTCDELIATEIVFNNILEPLNPPEVAGILSALVFQEKTDEDARLTTRMEVAKADVREIKSILDTLRSQEGIAGDIADNDGKGGGLNFGLAAVVYQWARGVPFKQITEMTLVHEGSIVRTITRLDELLKDFRNAARAIGNPSLYRKMEAASQCIKRDIVFAASLYI